MTREWWCSVLIRLYPPPFRERYGREIVDTILDLRRESTAPRIRFWICICADACRAAIGQHVEAWKRDSRSTLNWIAACTLGAAAWKAIGTGLASLFAYFYHPYLEGTALTPWLYGATLGGGLAVAQCLVVRRLPPVIWIAVSAGCAAVGLEIAVLVGSSAGPLGFGAVVGVTVACGQWVVLRQRFQRARWLAAIGGFALSMAAISLSVAMHHSPLAINALNHYAIPADSESISLVHVLYAPMDWTEWNVGLLAIATAGLVVGAITARPVSSMFSDTR